MILATSILASLNLLVISGCLYLVSQSPRHSYDGLGPAIIAMGCVVLSLVLTGIGVACTILEIRKKRFIRRAVIATFLAAAPLGVAYVGDALLLLKYRNEQKAIPSPNPSRTCGKSDDANLGNDPILNLAHFDEHARRIRWSKNEFPQIPRWSKPFGRVVAAVGCTRLEVA